MNDEKYARVTVVLEKDTAGALRVVSEALGVSVSELTRGILEQPVSMMRAHVGALRSGDPADRAEALQSLDLFAADALADLSAARGLL